MQKKKRRSATAYCYAQVHTCNNNPTSVPSPPVSLLLLWSGKTVILSSLFVSSPLHFFFHCQLKRKGENSPLMHCGRCWFFFLHDRKPISFFIMRTHSEMKKCIKTGKGGGKSGLSLTICYRKARSICCPLRREA